MTDEQWNRMKKNWEESQQRAIEKGIELGKKMRERRKQEEEKKKNR